MSGLFRRKPAEAEGAGDMVRQSITAVSPEKRAAALEAARVARQEKTTLLNEIRGGRVSLQDLLGPDYAGNERVQRLAVASLLRALPGVTSGHAEKIMTDARIYKGRRVQGLTARQREALLDWARSAS